MFAHSSQTVKGKVWTDEEIKDFYAKVSEILWTSFDTRLGANGVQNKQKIVFMSLKTWDGYPMVFGKRLVFSLETHFQPNVKD